MISKSIAVIEHNDLFYSDLIFNDEPDLAMFRYKNENEKFVSHEELQNIKMLASKGVFNDSNLLIFLVITFIIQLYSSSKVMPPYSRPDSFFYYKIT